MDLQTYVNIFLTVGSIISAGVGSLVLFILSGMRNCINQLERAIIDERKERHALALNLSNNYVSVDKMQREINMIFEYLRRSRIIRKDDLND